MRAEELMIGDWVSIEGKPCKVEVLRRSNEYELPIGVESEYGVVYYSGDYVEPIILTSEILEKNGWYFGLTSNEEDLMSVSPAHFVSHWAYDEGGGEISLFFPNESDGGCLRICDQNFNRSLEFVYCDTIYVHELQNALRLCGMNELANNFKV